MRDTVLSLATFSSLNAATGAEREIFVASLASPVGTLSSVNALGVVISAAMVWSYTREEGVMSEPPIVRGRCVMLAEKLGRDRV